MASGSTVYKKHAYKFEDDGSTIVARRRGEPDHGGQAFSADGGKTFKPFGTPALPPSDMDDVAEAYRKATAPTGPSEVTVREATETPETIDDLDRKLKESGYTQDSEAVDPKTKN